ncbi:MAG: hypothetical protein WBO48_20870, partial [Candidatus Promineifilaceae bacterium]
GRLRAGVTGALDWICGAGCAAWVELDASLFGAEISRPMAIKITRPAKILLAIFIFALLALIQINFDKVALP